MWYHLLVFLLALTPIYPENEEQTNLSLPKEAKDDDKTHFSSFITSLPLKIQDSFRSIWINESIPKEQKSNYFLKLANELMDKKMLQSFINYRREVQNKRRKLQMKFDQLSEEAKIAHAELMKLREQHHNIYKKMSLSARKELSDLYNT